MTSYVCKTLRMSRFTLGCSFRCFEILLLQSIGVFQWNTTISIRFEDLQLWLQVVNVFHLHENMDWDCKYLNKNASEISNHSIKILPSSHQYAQHPVYLDMKVRITENNLLMHRKNKEDVKSNTNDDLPESYEHEHPQIWKRLTNLGTAEAIKQAD